MKNFRGEEHQAAFSKAKRTRVFRILVIICVATVVGWFAWVTVNIVAPVQSEPGDNIDAVVSLAPQFDRLTTAEQILQETGTSHFLISYFPNDRYLAGPGTGEDDIEFVAAYCYQFASENVRCETPGDATTRGEAAMISRIADSASWQSVTVVTSQYHVFRTRLILDRCLDPDVHANVVFSEVDLDAALWLRFIVYENAAYVKAQVETVFRC